MDKRNIKSVRKSKRLSYRKAMNVKEIRRKNLRTLSRMVGGVTQLAERLGKSQSQISHLIGTNPVKNIGDKFAAEVEKVFAKPAGWLDQNHPGVQEEDAIYQVNPSRRTYYQVPLITWQEAQQWLMEREHSPAKNYSQTLIINTKVSQHSFALRVEGDSMEAPTGVSFPHGSIIVVDLETPATNGSFILAKQNISSQIVFKQLIIDGNRRYLKPLNARYPLMEITPHAVMCGVIRLMLIEFK